MKEDSEVTKIFWVYFIIDTPTNCCCYGGAEYKLTTTKTQQLIKPDTDLTADGSKTGATRIYMQSLGWSNTSFFISERSYDFSVTMTRINLLMTPC